MSRYTRTTAPASPISSPSKDSVMVFTWPRSVTLEPRGDEAEVRALHRAVDVEHRHRVVMAHYGGRGGPSEAREVCQQLRAARSGDGRCRQVMNGGKAELRRLRRDVVLRTGLGVDPEARRGLEASGERHQHIRGHVAFGETKERRLAAVDVDPDL